MQFHSDQNKFTNYVLWAKSFLQIAHLWLSFYTWPTVSKQQCLLAPLKYISYINIKFLLGFKSFWILWPPLYLSLLVTYYYHNLLNLTTCNLLILLLSIFYYLLLGTTFYFLLLVNFNLVTCYLLVIIDVTYYLLLVICDLLDVTHNRYL